MDKIYIVPYPENDRHMEPEPRIRRHPDTRNSRKKRRDRATRNKEYWRLLRRLLWNENKIIPYRGWEKTPIK